MELDPVYTFVPLASKIYCGNDDKATREYLNKWGLNGNINVQHFSFNEPFQSFHKHHLAEAFFKSDVVAKELKTRRGNSWVVQGITASSVELKSVPCSVLGTSFFDKLKDPENNVVYESGNIRKRYDLEIDGFLISDNLRGMLLDEECDEYNLYTENEREEFIFRIFQMLILGGTLCQYEDTVKPYLDITKNIYKDLIRVQKQEVSGDLSIATTVLEVIVKNQNGHAYFPTEPYEKQNIGFLLIDGNSREITTFVHQFGGFSW
ncbi:uncharacterized protein C11orf70 homolog [Orussus abietinus]|uniref:uncharacterized protein C11orf70 homolog n=1 Tax=Orussus abietinus TaxID=222816 RepID=UPI000625DC61|nr:uncharacterized protein C11orf70 homolog [Orussus abietinus]